MNTKKCPICDNDMYFLERYPNMICNQCFDNTVTKDGLEIKFYNENITGGFYSLVNNKKGNIHECYINNKKCYADEARFGGIVIQKLS